MTHHNASGEKFEAWRTEDGLDRFDGDNLDALAAGINMLGEEIEAARRELEERVIERTHQLELLAGELKVEVVERRRSESAVRDAQDSLRARLAEVERLNDEIMQLAELTNLLQVCTNRQEAFDVLAQAGLKLFVGTEGAVYMFVAQRQVMELVAFWHGFVPPETIDQSDCWGLRRGKLHTAKGPGGLRCAHTSADHAGDQLCMPLVAQGEVLGLLHLAWLSGTIASVRDGHDDGTKRSNYEQLAVAAAEQMALVLANLELRAELQYQSIRDPLTNLYNRRHLDETLVRELHRADRLKTSVSVLMIDIDRFKMFNDTYGHGAGDTALRQVAATLSEQVRLEDVVCRYGGEEFVVVMPGSGTDDAANRAEHLRTAISHIELDWHGQPLGAVTASFGVASYPADADSTDGLIRAADAALYEAKEDGRDRVTAYASPANPPDTDRGAVTGHARRSQPLPVVDRSAGRHDVPSRQRDAADDLVLHDARSDDDPGPLLIARSGSTERLPRFDWAPPLEDVDPVGSDRISGQVQAETLGTIEPPESHPRALRRSRSVGLGLNTRRK